MIVTIGIHFPRPGKEAALLETMRTFGEAQKRHKGLIMVHALKDEKANALIGFSIWDTRDSYNAARADMAKALQGANFDEWEEKPHLFFDCEQIL